MRFCEKFSLRRLKCLWLTVLLALLGWFLAADMLAQTEPEQFQNTSSAASGLLAMKSWSPYLAGAGIGILSWFAFLLSDHPLGVSTAFAKTSGMIEKAVRGDRETTRTLDRRLVST